MNLVRSALSAVLVLGFAASAQAVVIVPPVTFTGNATFNAPTVTVGTATLTSTTPTITNTTSGYNLTGPAYDLTAGSTAGQTIQTLWTSDRPFTADQNTFLSQYIFGNTTITGSGGSLDFNVTGAIYSGSGASRTKLAEVVFQDSFSPSATPHPEHWSLLSPAASLVTGVAYDLVLTSALTWTNVPAGATLHLASEYDTSVSPAAVPEPSSLVLTSLGLIGLVWARRKSRA